MAEPLVKPWACEQVLFFSGMVLLNLQACNVARLCLFMVLSCVMPMQHLRFTSVTVALFAIVVGGP